MQFWQLHSRFYDSIHFRKLHLHGNDALQNVIITVQQGLISHLAHFQICCKGHPSIRKYQPCLECKLFPSNYMIMHTRTIHNAIPIFKRHNRNKNKWCLCLGSDSWIKWKEKIFYTAIITFSLDANHFCNKWLNSFWSIQYINKIICNHAPKRTNL